MSEARRARIVYSASSGELVTAGDALKAPCWEPAQHERRWTAAALETLRSSLGNRQPSRIVDLGCGSGELTTRIASLWPAADIVAVDQSDVMTRFTQGSALAAGHRNVRAVTADAAGDLGIEPGTADLVVASCIAHNMLNEIAGHCPGGDTDAVGRPAACWPPRGCWSPPSRIITSSASVPGAGCWPAQASRSSLSWAIPLNGSATAAASSRCPSCSPGTVPTRR